MSLVESLIDLNYWKGKNWMSSWILYSLLGLTSKVLRPWYDSLNKNNYSVRSGHSEVLAMDGFWEGTKGPESDFALD